ncbi:MAG: DnaA regulatory inactivator Hda [Candidatus Thiodiazotropha lotti]|uniref:DnaA regulatory inactivator Hda n=1 Tax=Candidatus Thiodiazotropha endoloripes TaxID=1818881 RepID=A0A1E2UPU0_9GAMM|nr:DnaA regulatory inactivator Hda [Candidatus Thiodiazotropha endoloripes]MCG7897825.1 DnaA regulatory inactivator Hda [Candidatus Thiodiazotropha weberae]MCG7993555.1 DnaA regulatory inactivator Hda [Candidatus Thiodiazotropha lotti]MCG7901234.1 DnaA regulatory inactivator Hda [Candidatus Thiodiazotropha weberae]MCG7914450.1 DnaA regulatory inactivator Hda [Candidatus Thiodiazotropha weberae]MCG7997926.1 DnaA regulatory inactivator Hda [Candidatus Thiodiazotropha lotti]
MSNQLPLGLSIRPRIDFTHFVIGRNGEAVSRLRGEQDPYIYLWGESGSGKSHLLQAACQQSQSKGEQPAYLPFKSEHGLQPEMLEGLDGFSLVCLDDLQVLAGEQAWEMAIFNLYNQLQERGAKLIIAGDRPPGQLSLHLADLASRLTWGPCYHLFPLNDEERLELLLSNAELRGLSMSVETAQFLLQRTPRDIHFLTILLDRLDQASLAAQRKLTIPFVREALKL